MTRVGAPHEGRGWRYWLDELFLHPHWGLLGGLVVFAAVLFVVFQVSAWLDSLTAARLIAWAADWQPQSTGGVIARAVVDGLIGLIGIVVPYISPKISCCRCPMTRSCTARGRWSERCQATTGSASPT